MTAAAICRDNSARRSGGRAGARRTLASANALTGTSTAAGPSQGRSSATPGTIPARRLVRTWAHGAGAGSCRRRAPRTGHPDRRPRHAGARCRRRRRADHPRRPWLVGRLAGRRRGPVASPGGRAVHPPEVDRRHAGRGDRAAGARRRCHRPGLRRRWCRGAGGREPLTGSGRGGVLRRAARRGRRSHRPPRRSGTRGRDHRAPPSACALRDGLGGHRRSRRRPPGARRRLGAGPGPASPGRVHPPSAARRVSTHTGAAGHGVEGARAESPRGIGGRSGPFVDRPPPARRGDRAPRRRPRRRHARRDVLPAPRRGSGGCRGHRVDRRSPRPPRLPPGGGGRAAGVAASGRAPAAALPGATPTGARVRPSPRSLPIGE